MKRSRRKGGPGDLSMARARFTRNLPYIGRSGPPRPAGTHHMPSKPIKPAATEVIERPDIRKQRRLNARIGISVRAEFRYNLKIRFFSGPSGADI
jgi:hypothetical protein